MVLPEAEPASFPGGPNGVLVLHGFTGNPSSMRPLATAIAAAGYTVELPLLPGHGTVMEDMIPTRWADWSDAALEAFDDLMSRCARVAVAGLSMGGTLATWLAATQPSIAGLVAINPVVEPPPDELIDALRAIGEDTMPGIGSDIAKPGVAESAYPGTPVAALLSLLLDGVRPLASQLGAVRCPVLLLTSTQDHVVPPSSSDHLASAVSGPVERVTLARSYHVATLDYDAADIETRTVEFLAKVFTA
ncbi:MAG: alpha/beta hydrolase [Acidimicrobiales bacterium]